MVDEKDLRYEWGYESRAGQHTNGPQMTSLTLTHIPTGLVVHIPMSKSQFKKKQVAIEMIEWALVNNGWVR